MTAPRRLRVATGLASLTLVLALAGCGGSDGSGDVASLGTTADQQTTANDQSSDQSDPAEAALDFARCMREHGVDMPDPDANGGFALTPDVTESPNFASAQKTCGTGLRGAPGGATPPQQLSDEDQAALQTAFLKFAKCMRENGVDIPDPDTSGPGGGFALALPKGMKPDDPSFMRAQKVCQPLLNKAVEDAGLPVPGGSS